MNSELTINHLAIYGIMVILDNSDSKYRKNKKKLYLWQQRSNWSLQREELWWALREFNQGGFC